MLLRAIATAVSLATASPADAPSAAAAEVARVQFHLDGALSLIASRDLRALTDAQRARRAALAETLHAYRDAGQFPINRHHPGEYVPYFRDAETGVLCAVGFLLASTGWDDLVEEIVSSNNYVRVRDLAGHEEFRRWLDEQGLLLEEAARIQPSYGGPWIPDPPGPRVSKGTLEISALAATSLAVVGLVVPPATQPRLLPIAGLATGLTAVVLGVRGEKHETTNTIALVNLGVGAIGTVIASRTLTMPRQEQSARRVSVAPFLGMAETRTGAPGIAVTLRF